MSGHCGSIWTLNDSSTYPISSHPPPVFRRFLPGHHMLRALLVHPALDLELILASAFTFSSHYFSLSCNTPSAIFSLPAFTLLRTKTPSAIFSLPAFTLLRTKMSDPVYVNVTLCVFSFLLSAVLMVFGVLEQKGIFSFYQNQNFEKLLAVILFAILGWLISKVIRKFYSKLANRKLVRQGRILNLVIQDDAVEVRKCLEEDGSLVRARDECNRTLLHVASNLGRIDVAKCLIEYGADVNAVDSWRKTPLDIAQGRNNRIMIELLSSAEVQKDPQQQDSSLSEIYRLMDEEIDPVEDEEIDWPMDEEELDLDLRAVQFLQKTMGRQLERRAELDLEQISCQVERLRKSVDVKEGYTDLEETAGQGNEGYDSFPEHLKGLFLYCSLFPSHYEFKKDELVQMWIAEGFIRESQMRERLEDIGSEYFNSLHKMGCFVSSRSDSRVDFDSEFSVPIYNPGNLLYRVNPIKLSDLEHKIAPGDYFIAVDGKLDGAFEMTQHLSLIYKDIDEMTFGVVKKFNHLRTLLLLSRCGSCTKNVPRDLFLSLKFLRTLNLARTLISELPSSIRNAKSLRYLDLSNTPITRLPESIDSVHSLQTIKLRDCIHFLQLPKGMKKLIHLRHIELDIIRQLRSMPPHLGSLTNLQTLSAYIVGREDGCRIGELKNLHDLRGVLRISRLENVWSKEEAEEAALIDKKCLQRLELRWSNVFTDKTQEQEKILECLQPHAGLKELQIHHYAGSTLPTWISTPFAELVVLTLYRCINCLFLPSIGQLPMLKSLSIIEMNEVKEINHEFLGHCTVNQTFHAFPKLEILEVDIMLNLKEWKELKSGDFPSLLKLTVDSCPELDTLPSLSWLKSLKNLEFRRCPKILSLPCDGLPTSLESFIVIDCPELKQWCCKAEGEDWRKMCHVPSIWLDCEEVRSKSHRWTGTSVDISEENVELDDELQLH